MLYVQSLTNDFPNIRPELAIVSQLPLRISPEFDLNDYLYARALRTRENCNKLRVYRSYIIATVIKSRQTRPKRNTSVDERFSRWYVILARFPRMWRPKQHTRRYVNFRKTSTTFVHAAYVAVLRGKSLLNGFGRVRSQTQPVPGFYAYRSDDGARGANKRIVFIPPHTTSRNKKASGAFVYKLYTEALKWRRCTHETPRNLYS